METQTEELVVQRPDLMLTIIERAVMSPEFDVAKLQQLLELKERYEAAEAKRAFVAAKAKFKTFAITITKDKANKQYESRYTSLGNLVNTVTPFLSQCGLDASWELDQSAGIKVSCVLTHDLGHSSRVSLIVPPDTSGAKNTIQQIKSAITYARNLTFESVCGLASTDKTVNADDDGNGASRTSGLSEERTVECLDWIANAATHEELKRTYQIAYKEATEAKDSAAQRAYVQAKNTRYKEIANAGR